MLSELENDLDETQSLKLRLIEEEKRHRYTKKELEEIRRSSIVFSDSSSSGLFPDYDSNPSDESEAEVEKEQPQGSHESFALMLTDNEVRQLQFSRQETIFQKLKNLQST